MDSFYCFYSILYTQILEYTQLKVKEHKRGIWPLLCWGEMEQLGEKRKMKDVWMLLEILAGLPPLPLILSFTDNLVCCNGYNIAQRNWAISLASLISYNECTIFNIHVLYIFPVLYYCTIWVLYLNFENATYF